MAVQPETLQELTTWRNSAGDYAGREKCGKTLENLLTAITETDYDV